MLMEKAKSPAFWQRVRSGEEYRNILDQIRGYYTQSRQRWSHWENENIW